MKQHTFSISDRPRVVMRHVQGNLNVHSWTHRSIEVRVQGENEDGSTVQPYQEGDTVFLNDCRGDIELYVPYEKGLSGNSRLRTDVSVSDLDGTITMENVGSVDLQNVSSSVTLAGVDGSLRATNVPTLRENKGIGGSTQLTNVSRVDIGTIGGSLQVTEAETVNVSTVGGGVQARRISSVFHCSTIGDGCELYESPDADIALSNVGGSLHTNGIARMPSCTVGGSLSTKLSQPLPNSSTQFTVGGSASLSIPHDANLRIHILAGGSIQGNAVEQKRNNMATLTYGDGSASLSITADGSVKIDWASESTYPNRVIPFDLPNDSTAQRREAILKMVEQGRISPEEGNMLLDALE